MTTEINFSIILPTLNEKENIRSLIPDIIKLAIPAFEIIVVDDGSSDGTREAVLDLKKSYEGIVLISRDNEKGYASAIRRGVEVARGEFVVWLDCDYSHPPELIEDMISYLARYDADIVVASRFLPTSKDLTYKGSRVVFFQKVLSRCLSCLCRLLFYNEITDYTSGYICIRKKIIPNTMGIYGDFFMELVIRCLDSKLRYFEIPYVSPPRKHGKSKTGTSYIEIIFTGRLYLIAMLRLFFRRK